MNFIRRIGRDEIYIKYVHQLVNVGSRHMSHSTLHADRLYLDAPPITKLC
jgi:hypothetical protein